MAAAMIFILGKVGVELLEYPVALFDSGYTAEWLNNPLGKYIIKAIDKSDVIEGEAIKSPVLKVISPERLSCGCKSVLLAAFHSDAEKYVFDGSKMGDNCFPVLFDVVRQTKRKIQVQVGRLLREPWREDDVVLIAKTGEKLVGYNECLNYLAMNTSRFYKGDGYGTQG